MNENKLRGNVEFAKQAEFSEIYLWGAEWWYWLKTERHYDEVWETAKELFRENRAEKIIDKNIRKENHIAKQEKIDKKEREWRQAENKEKKETENEIPKSFLIKNVPFVVQAPLAVWDEYHEEACEEASLIMLKYYLDEKTKINKQEAENEIQKIIKFQNNNYGDYRDSNMEELVKLAYEFYGIKKLQVVYDFDKDEIKKQLAKGKPIIVPTAGRLLSNPYFTPPGPLYHNLILIGYRDNIVVANDPGTKRGESYEYKLDVLYNAIHDFPGNKNDIEKGRKAMIVVN